MNSKASDRVYAVAASVFLGLAAVSATVGIGTANAGCANANGGALVDCDGMLHSDMSPSTKGGYVDGQNGWIDGQGVEPYDPSPQVVNGQGTNNGGTQGEVCGGSPGSYMQTTYSCGSS